MRRSIVFLLLIVFTWVSVSLGAERKGIIEMNFKITSGKGHKTRLWVPYPLSDQFQKISNVEIKGNYERYGVYRESGADAVYLYAEWNKPAEIPKLTFQFRAETKERSSGQLREKGTIPIEIRKYLETEELVSDQGKIKEIARRIVEGKETILEKARAVYDWVVENTYRDPDVRGCGRGIVEETLAKRGGKCADISSVFVALARASGVPARDVYGLRLSKTGSKDMTGGFHCWAEFYLPGTGWVPVDPADVRKIMLVKKLDLDAASSYREYYFGKVDPYRIVLEKSGRNISLDPAPSQPLNYFMYPHGEVDGRPLDHLDPKHFSYSVHFREIR